MNTTATVRTSNNAAWAAAMHDFKRQEWANRIREINTSGKTKKQWAKENGFAPITVYHWYSILKREAGGDVVVKQGVPTPDHFHYSRKMKPEIQKWVDHMKELVNVDVNENEAIFSRNGVVIVIPKSKLTIELIVHVLTDMSKI